MIIDFEDPEVIESFSYLYVSDVDKYKYKRQKFDPAKELNDPTLLHNIRERYVGSNLIYTYSSMFCIAVNPYRDLPIYTRKMIQFYCGKKKGEAPPHVFYMADSAYSGMRRERRNQSILIT